MRWLAILFAVVAAGCATKLGRDGSAQSSVDIRFLAKSDVDRIADTTRTEVVDGLLLIADKLYKRNPREWKKGAAASREAAVQRLRQRISRNWPELAGQRERKAATLAFIAGYVCHMEIVR
jgi:hypothetical protein